MFNFVILDPRPIPAAKEANEKIFADGSVFGIEVTIPELAKRCVGNIDPQHTGGDVTRAAIEEAMVVDLPSAPTIATVRPDLDSIGAMAIMLLKEEHNNIMMTTPHGNLTIGKYGVWGWGLFESFLSDDTKKRFNLLPNPTNSPRGVGLG